MRVVAISLLALLLAPMATAAEPVVVGREQTVSDAAVELQTPGIGDDFVVWGDSRRGVSDIYFRYVWDTQTYRLTMSDPTEESNESPRTDGRWVAWVRLNRGTPVPGSDAGAAPWSFDYVVYDMERRAIVYDSDTSDVDETLVRVADDRLLFLRVANGQQVAYITDLTGPRAFVEEPLVEETGKHAQPTISDSHVVFLRQVEDDWQLVSVDLKSRDMTVVAEALDGIGYSAPILDGHRLLYFEFEGPRSSVVVVDLRTMVETYRFDTTDYRLVRGDLRGDLLVVESWEDGKKPMRAWCMPDGEPQVLPGQSPTRFFPALGDWGGLVWLSPQSGGDYIYEQPIGCGSAPEPLTGPSKESPLPLLVTLFALVLVARRR